MHQMMKLFDWNCLTIIIDIQCRIKISPCLRPITFDFLIQINLPLMIIEDSVHMTMIGKDHGQSPIHSAQTLKACISESV